MTDHEHDIPDGPLKTEVDGLTTYLENIDAPVLVGELRCLTNSIASTMDANGLAGTPLGAAFHFLTLAVSRFDAAAPAPLPIAVDGVCRCSDDDGATSRLRRVIVAMREERPATPPDVDLEAIGAQIAEAVKGIPGVSGATMVAVPMRGGQPVGDPITVGEVKAPEEEPPAPGLYL